MGAFLVLYAKLQVPEADQVALAQTTTVYYADGSTEMGALSDVNRTIVDESTLPDYVGKAVVASEDRSFYTNSGVDFKGIARALLNNVTGGARQGASTLTQQYVERYYLGETTSYPGKIKEAVLAVKINREQTKDEILGNYMNTIYFGRGTYGIEAASKAYFGHPAKDLTLSESAMLSGIIPAPSAWDPAVDSDQARARWQRVIDLMVTDGWISQTDADAATFPETIEPSEAPSSALSGTTGYLLQQTRAELQRSGKFTDEQIDTGGLKIVSTINKADQDAAVRAAESMTQVSNWDPNTMQTALSSVDPTTGEIVAEYAGSDYQKRFSNAVTQDIAMAGSTTKPFALLANAQQGGTLNDIYSGRSPQRFPGLENHQVQNDGGFSFGNVNLKRATEYSINTAFVALNEKVGPANTMQAAIDAGFPEDTVGLEPTLLNVLGTSSPRNIDLTHAYATLANGGQEIAPHIVREVQDFRGNSLFKTDTKAKRVFDAGDVSSIMPALEAVMGKDGTGEKASKLGLTVAGKTGTSEDQMSAQFVGFTPKLATAVSMYQTGEDGVSSVRLTNVGGVNQFHGGDWPADVWLQYMQVATQGDSNEDFPWLTESTRKPSVAPTPTYAPRATQPSEEPSVTATPTPTESTKKEAPEAATAPTPMSPSPRPSVPVPDNPAQNGNGQGNGNDNARRAPGGGNDPGNGNWNLNGTRNGNRNENGTS